MVIQLTALAAVQIQIEERYLVEERKDIWWKKGENESKRKQEEERASDIKGIQKWDCEWVGGQW